MQEKDKRSTKQCKRGFNREETALVLGIYYQENLHYIQCSLEFKFFELNSIFWLFQSQRYYQVKSNTGSLQLGT